MKKIFSISLICTLLKLHAQEFSFDLYFTDAVGNRDTITLGYDSMATNGIDPNFGEINIITKKVVKPFEVWISDEWKTQLFGSGPGTFHTKKQIISNHCWPKWDDIQGIDIYTKNWPVTVSWDTSLFKDPCRIGSLLTCVSPGGWWDVGCSSNLGVQLLLQGGIKTFNSNSYKNYLEHGYVNSSNDTINYYFLAIGGAGIFHVAVKDETKITNLIKVIPNPVNEKLSLQISENFGKLQSFQIHSMTGQFLFSTNNIDIDFNNLTGGVYFIIAQNDMGRKAIARFIKN